MNKIQFKILIVIFFALNWTYSMGQSNIINTVVLDAGHGGKDPGALNSGVKEKNITLPIVLLAGHFIKENFPDIKVIYTRDEDVFIPLHKRAIIANENDADLFISVHANSIAKNYVYGTETFVLGLHRSEDNLRVAMQENSALYYEDDHSVRYEGFDPNKPESYIIFNLIQSQHIDNSLLFAELVENQFGNQVKRNSRGVKQAGFLVLREVSMPSVLIETGFITNQSERNFLTSKKGQEKIAISIYQAFKNYKEKLESSTNTITIENEIYFAVQILSTKKKQSLQKKKFRKLKNLQEHYIDNTYKYTVGKTVNSNEILKLQKKLQKKFKDCFIVGFHDGKRISFEQAKQLLRNNE